MRPTTTDGRPMSALKMTITARRPANWFTATAAPSGNPTAQPIRTATRLMRKLSTTIPTRLGSAATTSDNARPAASAMLFKSGWGRKRQYVRRYQWASQRKQSQPIIVQLPYHENMQDFA
jgi:hypothetical protein